MKCPNCGNEINENQNFCSNCGTKINEVEVEQAEITKQSNPNMLLKKIIIIILCVFLILLCAFGITQYQQYKKDITPSSTNIVFKNAGKVTIATKYEPDTKQALIFVNFNEIKIADWYTGYFKDYYSNFYQEPTIEILDKDTQNTITAKYLDTTTEIGNIPYMRYYIANVNSKYFAEIKDRIKNGTTTISVPPVFNKNKTTRMKEKTIYFKWKKEKEWQEKILSNCIYKSSNGVCFTTQVFEVEPIYEENHENPNFPIKNYWLGAKDYCESRGYKLPSDDDLRSLFSDILGITINAGVNIKTQKYADTTIPTNYEILKKIAPNGFNKYNSSNWGKVILWENEEFDNNKAYYRKKDNTWGSDTTNQSFADKNMSFVNSAICVYNPNGKVHKSILQEQKKLIEKAKREKAKQEHQTQQEAENELF